MRRSFVLVLLMISAFWQVIAMAGHSTAFSSTNEAAHALLHWHETNHHHGDDGTVTEDDSDESRQHVVADGCLGSLALSTTASFSFAPAGRFRPDSRIATVLPAPPPDGLRRPPRRTA
ncbi:conserved exported hypothetical protein [Burkholderiales bacterium 8X]|nr:conserved exported hypothetical protein [Burkholderiales bacterium 8X]